MFEQVGILLCTVKTDWPICRFRRSSLLRDNATHKRKRGRRLGGLAVWNCLRGTPVRRRIAFIGTRLHWAKREIERAIADSLDLMNRNGPQPSSWRLRGGVALLRLRTSGHPNPLVCS